MYTHTQKGGVGVWVLVVVLVGIGVFFFFTRSASDEGTQMPVEVAATQEVIVVYNANGFSPNVVTVKKGNTVVFQNKTRQPASVASGPHPTHTNYPEFNQYKTDQRGKDEFRFVFEKVGEWKYHDHLNANITGTVVVTE